MTRIYDFTWLKFHILLKKANQKERKDYICLFKQRMMENSIPYNRNYIKCPFCNGERSFRKIHIVEENDNLSGLDVFIGNKKKRLGNEMVFFSAKGKKYFILDIYYHIMDKHEYVPRKWFFRLLLNSSKR